MYNHSTDERWETREDRAIVLSTDHIPNTRSKNE